MKIQSAEFVKSAIHRSDYPEDDLPQVALIGRSNVGKSSLINYLLGRKGLVKTSRVPGKTRAIQFFRINRLFYLVDLPGLGYAKAGHETLRSMESALETYFTQAPALRGILYLLDIRLPSTKIDQLALEWLLTLGHSILPVATKGDKLGTNAARAALSQLQKTYDLPTIPLLTSTLKKKGADEVWEQVEQLLKS